MSKPTIRAKFVVDEVTQFAYGGEQAKLRAAYGTEGENASFAKATPNASLTITIDNPEAQGFFHPGQHYYLDFTPIAKPVPPAV